MVAFSHEYPIYDIVNGVAFDHNKVWRVFSLEYKVFVAYLKQINKLYL